ncbi:MAG: hypothetical protein U9N82_01180 [Thermodesulfobacteriota bacterium]|nr:hypothetical protein [Thermodesulfobacteriota bacterium]
METTLTIRLPEEMKCTLQSLCQTENKALRDLVRESLKNYLAIKQYFINPGWEGIQELEDLKPINTINI